METHAFFFSRLVEMMWMKLSPTLRYGRSISAQVEIGALLDSRHLA
jgi:hypothetical protein